MARPERFELEPLCGRERVSEADEWESAGEIPIEVEGSATIWRARRDSNLSRLCGRERVSEADEWESAGEIPSEVEGSGTISRAQRF